ncbi:MAG: metallophosphoesterase family protein [Bacteroidia bacterium]|nr:metallophosphoesterase family protein [Bacteroidia bacterium]
MNNRLFAIGDIHGCFNSFKKLIEEKIQITKSDKVVLLGDYIDRGSQSKEVIDYIIELQNNGFDIVPLLGNHEAMLLDAFDKDERLSLWIQNGGSETLRSFGISSLKNLAPRYLEFFNKLPYYFEFEDYLFVHAGFNDEIEDPFNDRYHMIWKCRKKYTHSILRAKTIIHGHCVVPSITCDEQIKNNNPVINLDTGCVYFDYNSQGRLTSLEIYTRTIHFV